MFKWYQRSAYCIAYLSDYDSEDPSSKLAQSRWFTRGWTLQELIAPLYVHFYDAQWKCFGTKQKMASKIATITGISSVSRFSYINAIAFSFILLKQSASEGNAGGRGM